MECIVIASRSGIIKIFVEKTMAERRRITAFIGKKYPMSSTFTSKVVIQQKVSPVIVVRIVTMRARKGQDKEGGRTSKKEVYREGV